jgi:hypothetical protein
VVRMLAACKDLRLCPPNDTLWETDALDRW